MKARKTDKGKITALYERLNRDNDLTGDSNSIIKQKKLLEDYAGEHGFANCVHFTDDGWSGANFESRRKHPKNTANNLMRRMI